MQLKFSFVRKTFRYVKIVCIWSFSSPYFSYFQSKYFHIQSECGKIRTGIFRDTDISRTRIRNVRLEIAEKVRSSWGTSPTEILEFFFSDQNENVYLNISENIKERRKMVEEIVQFSSLAENVVLNSETKFLVKNVLYHFFNHVAAAWYFKMKETKFEKIKNYETESL